MDLKDKIVNILVREIEAEYVRLEDEDGISGFSVSRRFEGMTSLDRQKWIDEVLSKSTLTKDEQRRVLMIAALTPIEYDSVGAKIRVHKIKEMAGGAIEIILHGQKSDAEYVRNVINNLKGVETTEPKPVSGAIGILMTFRAKGTKANPLTKEKAVSVLKKDPYIEVMGSV